MEKKRLITTVVICIVIFLLLAAVAGLITWLVINHNRKISSQYDTIELEGDGLGEISHRSAFARFRDDAHMFWWFYPTLAAASESRPIIMWLDGVVGLPPSLLANFATMGPYDFNLNRRNDSWVDEYNLLFVDAPVGTGYSFVREESQAARSLQDNSGDLLYALHSFYSQHQGMYDDTPLYIFGQGYGGQMAADFALLLQQRINNGDIDCNFQGIVLGNPIISPALVTSKLGFYLEELGYIEASGRSVIETLAEETLNLVETESYAEAFDKWASLEELVSETAGAVAVNLYNIVEKLTRETVSETGSCTNCARYVRSSIPSSVDVTLFMDGTVAPALGIFSDVSFDSQKDIAIAGIIEELMKPTHDAIEKILEETDLNVWIYNGNLDAISNTPGQLLWIEKLEWSGAEQWLSSARLPLAVGGQLEGYVRSFGRLHLYWMNVAGHMVPIDNPVATREVLRRIAGF